MEERALWASLEREYFPGVTEMTIWVLLLGCCFLTPTFLALRLAREAHASIAGYTVSLVIGMLIGTGCAAAMSKIHVKVTSQLAERSVSLQNAILIGTFAGELVWVGITGVIGWWVATLLLRIIR